MAKKTPLELYVDHTRKWQHCQACELWQTRKTVVFARGKIPADVLFAGEAPGQSENITGLPFVGPAGSLLDDIISYAVPDNVRWAMCNLICCIPVDSSSLEEGTKIAEPPVEAIEACSGRLLEFIDICRPKLIVCVGQKARDWLDVKWAKSVMAGAPTHLRSIPQISVYHPAGILRMSQAQRPLARQRCIVQIGHGIREHVLKEEKS